MPADLIGARYQLERELVRTPSLAVYEAEDRRAGTSAGIALELGGGREPRRERKLLGRRLARTVHPHLVSTFDRGKDGTRTYMAFRPPPRTLATELEAAPYPPNRVAQMAVDLSAALGVLHRAGIRLGTLHPGHVGIDADGEVRLSPWPLSAPPGGWGGQRAWSPPEIVAGASPSMAGDVWSLGAVLLSSLVGTGPGQLSEAATQQLADRLRHDADPVLVDAIGRSMVGDPSRRFASAGVMAAALRGTTVSRRQLIAAGRPRLTAGSRRVALASAAAAGVLSATTVGIGLSSMGGTGVASSGGVDRRPAATAAPPAAAGHPQSPPAAAPATASSPHGVVALTAPPSSPATTTRVTGATQHLISITEATTLPSVTEPSPSSTPTTPTTSAAGSPAASTPGTPTTGTGDPATSANPGSTSTTTTSTTSTTTPTTTTSTTTTSTTIANGSGSNPVTGTPGTPYSADPTTVNHGHGGPSD
ncbi:MAG TPA: hypothetical protein VG412_06410 [Acidimicrobiales bacterium]|nr:hypothetical protein [Acidimicrobiales bacterium]